MAVPAASSSTRRLFFEKGDDFKCILHAVNNAYGEKVMLFDDPTWMHAQFDLDPTGADPNVELLVAERGCVEEEYKTYGFVEVQGVFNRLDLSDKMVPISVRGGPESGIITPELLQVLAQRHGIVKLIVKKTVSLCGYCGHTVALRYIDGGWYVMDNLSHHRQDFTELPLRSLSLSASQAIIPKTRTEKRIYIGEETGSASGTRESPVDLRLYDLLF
jgi:hypothetical protein